MHITFAYLTNRRTPMIEWYFDSLHRELNGNYDNTRVVVVDFYADEPGRKEDFAFKSRCPIVHVTPMPSPWQGKKRYTYQDYFDAANARNTAICYAPDGFLVFTDDLSVLYPGWIRGVMDSISGGYVVLGAYKKVLELNVNNGTIAFKDNPKGVDSRWGTGSDSGAVPASGSAAFGCSFGITTQAYLSTNGQDHRCSGLGFEDVIFGMALENRGIKFKYDRRMLTLESEEMHTEHFERFNRKNVQGAQDTAHLVLGMVRNGQKWFENYFPDGGLAALRQHVLAGGKFPDPQPMHLWSDGTPLSEIRGTE